MPLSGQREGCNESQNIFNPLELIYVIAIEVVGESSHRVVMSHLAFIDLLNEIHQLPGGQQKEFAPSAGVILWSK